jgi:3-oxoacyl-[acyl-carrier protein] reductase
MFDDLKDKVAVVTGGSRGIGSTIVTSLAQCGSDCAFTYVKNKEAAEGLVREVEQIGRKSLPLCVDVRNFESAKKVAGQ